MIRGWGKLRNIEEEGYIEGGKLLFNVYKGGIKMLNNKKELQLFIKRVNKKLTEHSNIAYCLNLSQTTETKLSKYFKLTFEPFSYIKFEKIK